MTGGADGVVKVFNYETGKMLAHLRTHADSVEGVQFAEKSVPLLNSDNICTSGCAGMGRGVRRVAIRLPLRPCAQSIRLLSIGVDLFFFSLRLKLVASCSVDGKIKVW